MAAKPLSWGGGATPKSQHFGGGRAQNSQILAKIIRVKGPFWRLAFGNFWRLDFGGPGPQNSAWLAATAFNSQSGVRVEGLTFENRFIVDFVMLYLVPKRETYRKLKYERVSVQDVQLVRLLWSAIFLHHPWTNNCRGVVGWVARRRWTSRR